MDVESVPPIPAPAPSAPMEEEPRRGPGRPRLSAEERRQRRDEERAARREAEREAQRLKLETAERERAEARRKLDEQIGMLVGIGAGVVSSLCGAYLPPPLSRSEHDALVGAWTPVLAELAGESLTPVQAALAISLAILGPRLIIKLAGGAVLQQSFPGPGQPPAPSVLPPSAPGAPAGSAEVAA